MKYELHLKLWHPDLRCGKWKKIKGFATYDAANAAAMKFPTWAVKVVEIEYV
jgi:hypothetical protein